MQIITQSLSNYIFTKFNNIQVHCHIFRIVDQILGCVVCKNQVSRSILKYIVHKKIFNSMIQLSCLILCTKYS